MLTTSTLPARLPLAMGFAINRSGSLMRFGKNGNWLGTTLCLSPFFPNALGEPSLMTPTLKGSSLGWGMSPYIQAPPAGIGSRRGFYLRPSQGALTMNVITVSREYGAGGGEVA